MNEKLIALVYISLNKHTKNFIDTFEINDNSALLT